MLNPKSLDDISARISEMIAASPAKDIQKNARALLASAFARLDLVTREDFDLQVAMLARTREKLTALEARVAALEAGTQKPSA
jgi:BMFP domain-containing protein YqiC